MPGTSAEVVHSLRWSTCQATVTPMSNFTKTLLALDPHGLGNCIHKALYFVYSYRMGWWSVSCLILGCQDWTHGQILHKLDGLWWSGNLGWCCWQGQSNEGGSVAVLLLCMLSGNHTLQAKVPNAAILLKPSLKWLWMDSKGALRVNDLTKWLIVEVLMEMLNPKDDGQCLLV